MARKKPRKSKLTSLDPCELSFLLDDESYCRRTVPRDMASLEELRKGGRQLLWGTEAKTAGELLALYAREALELCRAANPGKLPSWWGLLTNEQKAVFK
jgi:hypothetical protein